MRSIHRHAEGADVKEGWFHYSFDITEARISERGWLHIEAKAFAEGTVAGFGLEFEQSDWQHDQVHKEIWFDYGRGAIFSLGAESDRFASFLSYELGVGHAARFVEMIETDVVMINSFPEAMLTKRCNTKFFFGDDDDSESQVFINFNVPQSLVEFREKDLDFRPALVRQLVVH